MYLYLILTIVVATVSYIVYGKVVRVQENKTLASPSPPPPPPPPPFPPSQNWEHHVFVSFRGEDVREGFLSHLLKELKSKAIDPFMDNGMKKGGSITPELKRAIKGSKIAIILVSKNYASSSWCLNELVKIIKCRNKWGQKVITIFYQVEPTDVKKQAGDFGKVFKETCKGKTSDVIQKWREALVEVATITGYDSRNWVNEAVAIEEISTDVSKLINHLAPSQYLDRFIGLKAHMDKMQPFLRFDLVDEVRIIGIWGPLGIGKSTICRCLFNEYSSNFPLKTIMVNIKQRYPSPCLDEGNAQLQLQNDMLSRVINHKDIEITHLGTAQDRLKEKKVFLVLDDVDRHTQLEALAGDSKWFSPGSRIIVATENLRVLLAHGIDLIYKVKYPSPDEAFGIFCMYAFPQKFPYDGFTELARQITYYAGNLPLRLQVIGSYFLRRPKHEWIEKLPKLRSCLDGNIENILKFSYDVECGQNWEHDVFVSFCGKDVRTTYLHHIIREFERKGINTLIDNGMKRGSYITAELMRAIRGCRLVFVVLSENYASSSWCLNTLVTIITYRVTIGIPVIPIFYKVEPTDVKNRTGDFGKLFKRTCKGKKMKKWIEALAEVATIASFGSIIWFDEALARLDKMQLSFCLDLMEEVRIIGGWGPPRIGISKNSRSLFNQLSGNFQLKAIMVNIKQIYPKSCLDEGSAQLQLQNDISSMVINQKDIVIAHLAAAQDRLKDKKVLIVLDDVDQPAQLLALAENSQWFGPISRIIIATKLLRVLLDSKHSPVTYWPTIAKLENLVELNISRIKLEKFWERIQCKDSENVREIPCLSTVTSLKEPNLENCSSLMDLNATNLVELPSSIGNLPKLKRLTLRGCSKLKVLLTNIRYPCSLITPC